MQSVSSLLPSLPKGGRIALIAPAKPIEANAAASCVKVLESYGYCVIERGLSYQRRGYFSGSDQERALALMDAFCDPSVDAIWCHAGGYGSMRLLPLLDFNLIACHPKPFIGMSDITALHAALSCYFPTYLGPNLTFAIKRPDLLRQTLAYLHNPKLLGGSLVCGGNLSLIAALCGTPWQLQTKGKRLLLEDVNEEPYRIDRMLTQLKLSGLFDHLAGVILGGFTNCQAQEPNKSRSLEDVFADFFPSYEQMTTGHIEEQLTICLC